MRSGTLGSSPLARGLQRLHHRIVFVIRIIPARAGFTVVAVHDRDQGRDHPRSRGVYPSHMLRFFRCEGSSPLARGLLHDLCHISWWGGIIPARAGFTTGLRPAKCSQKDHPRSRGVYEDDPRLEWMDGGSSPLARGLLRESGPQIFVQRIIPARAGFTTRHSWRNWRRRDHPRSRGVYTGA